MEFLTIYFKHPACDICFNEKLNAVQTKWKGLFVQGDEFRLVLDKIIELLAKKKVHIIIADAREMKVISSQDQQWILDSWYPRALAAGFSFEGLIVSKNTFNEHSIKKIVHNYDDKKVETVYFFSYEEAEDWIKNNIALKE